MLSPGPLDPGGRHEAISIRSLQCRVSDQFELDIADLAVEDGAICAIVGVNGSGKSCLLECIAGQRNVPEATGWIVGVPIASFASETALRKRIGVQLQRNAFPQSVPVAELFKLHRALYGAASPELLEAFEIGSIGHLGYGKLSRGQRQRVDLCMALAHRPDLVLLDEPSTGLDARFTEVLCSRLRENVGSTILMATHLDTEIAIADEIVWMDAGRVIEHGPRAEIIQRHVGTHKIALSLRDPAQAERCQAVLQAHDQVIKVVAEDAVTLKAFGLSPLDPLIETVRDAVESYSVGRSQNADFLGLVGGRNA